ncbi:MAG TPA: ABC-2 family transporter protein [Polyangia bacterium]|jgi:ABC-2 type transport system permease protein|nr:ABC-2 family transporter protein [Polyangia bacterium]
MARYLRLYRAFLAQWLKTLLQYRFNFVVGAASTLVQQATGLLVLWVAMLRVPRLGGLGGWGRDEILLVYGLLLLAKAINHLVADNLWSLGILYIRTGRLDTLLVRPVNPLFHVLVDRFGHDGLGSFALGVALVCRAALRVGVAWTPLQIAYLVVAVLSGGVIFIALNLITSTVGFYIIDAMPLTLAVFQTHELAQYPVTIYRKGVRVLVMCAVPYVFASYVPASYLLGKDAGWLAGAGPLVAGGLLFVGYRLWQRGLEHYGSTGA